MCWVIFNVLSAAPASWLSECQIRDVSAPLSSKMGGNSSSVGRAASHWDEMMLFYPNIEITATRKWCVFVCVSFTCVYTAYDLTVCIMWKLTGTAQASPITVPYSIVFIGNVSLFMGRCLSIYLLTHSGTEDFWKAARVTGSLTGAELRLTIHSQMYRAPCWRAAKWLCLSLWGNSLLSLMLTVVVG